MKGWACEYADPRCESNGYAAADANSFFQMMNFAKRASRFKRPSEAVWSNEAFEIWYLLHFEFYDTGITRDTYKQRIQTNFRNKGLVDFVYAKNRTDMFDLLTKHGNRNLAIKHSQRLESTYNGTRDFANQNPCTTVYKLVVELFNLEKVLAEDNNNVAKF